MFSKLNCSVLGTCLALTLISVPAGAQGFQQIYPTTYDRTVFDVVRLANGGYMLAGMSNNSDVTDSDLYVMRTDGGGNLAWDTVYAGAKPEAAQSIVATDEGDFIIAGYTQSLGGGDLDMNLLKVNQQGRLIKQVKVGGTSNEEAMKIIKAHEGGYLVLGSKGIGDADSKIMLVKINSNLETEWEKYYEAGTGQDLGRSIRKSSDGGYMIAGQTTSKGMGGFDAYVIKLKSDYTPEWDATYGTFLNQDAVDIVVNDDATFVVLLRDSLGGSVSSDGNINIVAIKGAGSNGGEIWSRTFGGDDKDTPKSICRHGSGYLVGAISRSGVPAPNMWVMHLNESGHIDWGRMYGDYYEHDHCHIAKTDADGGVLAAGHQQKPVKKVYFLKLDAEGYVGLDDANMPQVNLFPNPCRGSFRVIPGNGNTKVRSVKVLDLLGREVSASVDGDEISIGGVVPGVYVVSAATDAGNLTSRLVVEK
jgi:hypothetical protein